MRKIVVFVMIAGFVFVFNSCKKAVEKVTPSSCFTISPSEIHSGDVVTFSSSCSENATDFSWDFGDGGTSTDVSPTHTYIAAGDFTITLTVKDAGGLSSASSQTITVAEPVIPPANIHEGNITSNETWAEGVHEVTGDVYVDGATLTIAPGTIIKFDQGTGLYIGYNGGSTGSILIANGTADKPILFTSSANTPMAGDWDYIGFYSDASATCSMKFCTVEYGGGYSTFGDIEIEDSKVTIENSYIQFSANSGITMNENGGFKSFTMDTVRENSGYAMELFGNYANTIGGNNGFMTSTGILVRGDTYNQSNATWNKLNPFRYHPPLRFQMYWHHNPHLCQSPE